MTERGNIENNFPFNLATDAFSDSVFTILKDSDAAMMSAIGFASKMAVTRNRADLQEAITTYARLLVGLDDLALVLEDSASEAALYAALIHESCFKGKPMVMEVASLLQTLQPAERLKMAYGAGMRELIIFGLSKGGQKLGLLLVFSRNLGQLSDELSIVLQWVALQLTMAISNIRAGELISRQTEEIEFYKGQREAKNGHLKDKGLTDHDYNEIVGSSPAMDKLFKMVKQVAPSSSSVLILGETGTGKELMARAIHNSSQRKNKLMVKINCATLPPNLIESELFGHERGSFTGATDRRIGKFELANNGTLFLDEIGELPLELQVKILRALQEKEIERIGGRTVIKTDVRIIAATNRDLQKEVQAGNFRSDLYFRLNVFPITIPPLRERKEDINLLSMHFLQKHAGKGNHKVIGFSSKVMKQLNAYNWPGNVRELEHLVERSILLASKSVINQIYIPHTDKGNTAINADTRIKSIDEVEREHIMFVLRHCKGKVSGIGGAAEVLNIPSTTLGSKIKRLGITKEFTSG